MEGPYGSLGSEKMEERLRFLWLIRSCKVVWELELRASTKDMDHNELEIHNLDLWILILAI